MFIFTKWYNGTMVQWYLCDFTQKLTNLSFVNTINEPSSLVNIHPSIIIPHNSHIFSSFQSRQVTA